MPQDLTNIPKSSVAIFLATDDGSLIFDDNDDTYLVISLADALKRIAKNILSSNVFKILEIPVAQGFRIMENSTKKITEDSSSVVSRSTKNTATLKRINKS